MTSFTIVRGFTPDQAETVAGLYWQAFSGKLDLLMGPDTKGIAFLKSVMNPDFALTAVANGKVLGVAGFKTAEGALTGGGFKELAAVYGSIGAVWRGPLLDIFDRDLTEGSLLMDGICVAEEARGQGVGSALLLAVKEETRARGLHEVRLDVINTNPRAKALYERQGFVAGKTEHLGLLKWLFGFSSSVSMRYAVRAKETRRDAAN